MTTSTVASYPVTLTESAVEEVKRLQATNAVPEGHVLRVGVKGGGCSGLSYVLDFDAPTANDDRWTQDGVEIVLDKAHALYLLGMTVDFSDGLNARGFEFRNPNATDSCGCGISFSAG